MTGADQQVVPEHGAHTLTSLQFWMFQNFIFEKISELVTFQLIVVVPNVNDIDNNSWKVKYQE